MNKLRQVVVIAAIGVALATNTCSATWRNHETTYTVVDGDSLTSIAQRYMTANCDLAEYREGIVEVNWDTVFGPRGERVVHPGDVLRVNYWVDER